MYIVVEINNNAIVSVLELNRLYDEVKKASVNDIRVYFKNRIDRIDIVFIAGIYLLNEKYGVRFSIDYNEIEDGKLFEVRQYMWHYDNIFKKNWKDVFAWFKRIIELSNSDDLISGAFVPIIYISLDTIHACFGDDSGNGVYEKINNLRERYIDELLIKKITKKENNEFTGAIESVASLLREQSCLISFVFCILFAKMEYSIKKNKSEGVSMSDEMDGLLRFTMKFVGGIYELAKNIVEHSEDGVGIITIRIYDEIKGDERTGYEKVIESYVVDYGEKGLVNKLLEDTKKKYHENKCYSDDYEILSGTYEMKDFIEPGIKTKLCQQLYRDLAHYGLMRFYKLIKQNEGVVVSSSNGKDGERDRYGSLYDKEFNNGTAYYFCLPFMKDMFVKEKIRMNVTEMLGTQSIISSLSEILDYSVIKQDELNLINEKDKGKIVVDFGGLNKIHIRNRGDELNYLRQYRLLSDNCGIRYVSIDMKNLVLGASSLLRIFAHLSGQYSQIFIVYNLDYSLYNNMIEENEDYLSLLLDNKDEVPYWYEDKALLVYTYLDGGEYYFADMLYGKNVGEFKSVNYLISFTYPNISTIIYGDMGQVESRTMRTPIEPYFYKSTLIPFDLLLKSANGEALFYRNLKKLLKKDINSSAGKSRDESDKGLSALEEYIDALDGYMLRDTHFKIGAKIHSSEFYYAKRLFQNSYYTGRIALLLTMKIREALLDKEMSFTLIGYEMYSELLMGLIKKFLRESGYKNFEHVLAIDDGGKIEHLPKNYNISDNVIIIVPIASTGSTSNKIIEYVNGYGKELKKNILISVNVLRAIDLKKYDSMFGKCVYIPQWDMIKLQATWYEPGECPLCFNNEKSKTLFGTDKSVLTPTLIFDVPLIKKDDDNITVDFAKVKFDNALLYRREKRNEETFLFSISINEFINNNIEAIKTWLKLVRNSINIEITQKVVILSPCHHTNTRFIDLVNEEVFGSAATVIHHQVDTDFLENFKMLNGRYINDKNIKSYFVDDSLISGGHFFKIYDLYRYSTRYDENKRLGGAIFLTNNSSSDISVRVGRASGKLLSFVNINVPVPPRVFDKKPLEHEIRRYEELSRTVLIDNLKVYYKNRSEDVAGLYDRQIDSPNKEIRHLKMFKATHYLYEYLASKDTIDIEYNDLLRACNFKHSNIEDRMALMKILSQYPFILYIPIRKKTFYWHKEWINTLIKKIYGMIEASGQNEMVMSIADYKELKFLIRRSVFLENYVIVSKDFFRMINMLMVIIECPEKYLYRVKHYVPEDIFSGEITEKVKINEDERIKLTQFYDFLIKQYVELINKNKWVSIKIINGIDYVISKDEKKTNQWERLKSALRLEVAVVFNDFYELLRKDNDWRKLYLRISGDEKIENMVDIDEENQKISNYLKINNGVCESNKFKVSDKVFGIKNISGEFKQPILSFLWLKMFLENDKKSRIPSLSVNDKTDIIFKKMKSFFIEVMIGGFFIVKDGLGVSQLVYDCDYDDTRYIDEIDEKKHLIILNYFKSEMSEYDSYREYNKSEYGWYGHKECMLFDNDKFVFIQEKEWLLIVKLVDEQQSVIGVMGFYSKKYENDNVLSKQLLMLLRSDMSEYIKRHHKNDEFAALREAEAAKRFAYLAGHGRQVMRVLANEEINLFGNVVLTMEKLQYLFATKFTDLTGNIQYLRSKQNYDLFREIFYTEKISIKDSVEINMMADKIYETDIIENSVIVDHCRGSFQDLDGFDFNRSILRYICFELLVNAKKNRYVFIGGKCLNCNYNNNRVSVSLRKDNETILVRVSGTGPKIPDVVKERICQGRDVKGENEISGIKLINKVIKMMSEDNFMSVKTEELCGKCGLYNNTVILKLQPYV